MKDHKNPKVLSEGISWMIIAVDDFGVSLIKLKVCEFSSFFILIYHIITYKLCIFKQDLIDFSKDTGLQSSAAATRNSTIKLIGVLHRFVGPGIDRYMKGRIFLSSTLKYSHVVIFCCRYKKLLK